MPPPLNEDPSWGEDYIRRNRQERNEQRRQRNKVFEQGGGSPPLKIEQEENLFVDKNEQHTPYSNTKASDDLAFRTGPRKEGIVQERKNKAIHTHPNPFEELEDNKHENARDAEEETMSIHPKHESPTKNTTEHLLPSSVITQKNLRGENLQKYVRQKKLDKR